MSSVREEGPRLRVRDGALRALVTTGPVITSAELIVAGTFATLTVLPTWLLFEIGFAVALGVLLNTFIARSLLVPAPACIFGERSLWPGHANAAAGLLLATPPAPGTPG